MSVEIFGNSSCCSNNHLYFGLDSVKDMAESDQYCVEEQWLDEDSFLLSNSDDEESQLKDLSEASYWSLIYSYITRLICITPSFVELLLIPVIVYSSGRIFSLVRRMAVPPEKNRTEQRVNVANHSNINLYNPQHGELSAEEIALLRLLIIQLQTSFSHEHRVKVLQCISRYLSSAARSSITISMSRARGS